MMGLPALLGRTARTATHLVGRHRDAEATVGAVPLKAPQGPVVRGHHAPPLGGLRPGVARRRQGGQERLRHQGQRRRAVAGERRPAPLPGRAQGACPARRWWRWCRCRCARRTSAASSTTGLPDVHPPAHRRGRPRQDGQGHRPGHQGREGGPQRRRRQAPHGLERARRALDVRAGGPGVLPAQPRRPAPADLQPGRLQRAGADLPALPVRRRAGGGLPDGPGVGGGRAQRHRALLPRPPRRRLPGRQGARGRPRPDGRVPRGRDGRPARGRRPAPHAPRARSRRSNRPTGWRPPGEDAPAGNGSAVAPGDGPPPSPGPAGKASKATKATKGPRSTKPAKPRPRAADPAEPQS